MKRPQQISDYRVLDYSENDKQELSDRKICFDKSVVLKGNDSKLFNTKMINLKSLPKDEIDKLIKKYNFIKHK